MTLKKRFYITSFVAAIFAVLSFVFKDLQNEIPIIINMLLGGTILYILFFYLLETEKLKTNWTKPIYKNIFYVEYFIFIYHKCFFLVPLFVSLKSKNIKNLYTLVLIKIYINTYLILALLTIAI